MRHNSKSVFKLVIRVILLFFLVLGGYIVIDIIHGNLELKEVSGVMETYLYNIKGYSKQDINQIKYKYSFSSKPFGYDPYIIDVIFTDEPTVIYTYIYRQDEIIPYAVGSTNGVIPEKLKH